jgi:hypothetical protein
MYSPLTCADSSHQRVKRCERMLAVFNASLPENDTFTDSCRSCLPGPQISTGPRVAAVAPLKPRESLSEDAASSFTPSFPLGADRRENYTTALNSFLEG